MATTAVEETLCRASENIPSTDLPEPRYSRSGTQYPDTHGLCNAAINILFLQSSKAYDPSTICIPQRDFAIGIAIAGLLLIVAVIAAILILLTKRRRRKDLSTTGSSIYSGPYTNTAYSYSS